MRELPRSRRGYDTAATDALLIELTATQVDLERKCADLEEQAARLEADLARYQSQEQLMSKALLTATAHATTIKEEARREAELILSKARAEAERRTARAQQVEHERVEGERELLRLRRLAGEIQTGLSSFLTQALDELRPDKEAVARESRVPGGARETEPLVTALETAVKEESDQTGTGSDETSPLLDQGARDG